MKLGKLFLRDNKIPEQKNWQTPHGSVVFRKMIVRGGEYADYEVWLISDNPTKEQYAWLQRNGKFITVGVPDLPPKPKPKKKAKPKVEPKVEPKAEEKKPE